MIVAVFSTKPYDQQFLTGGNVQPGHELRFFDPRLSTQTAPLATGAAAVCAFVNDQLDRSVLQALQEVGVRMVALRCSGFNNVDLAEARRLDMTVARVPAYSPYAVAEHTVALMLTLNRKIHRAFNRVREGNFAIEGLLGFDMHGKTVGLIGTGRIGLVAAKILRGFGCELLAFDPVHHDELEALGTRYVPLDSLLRNSDIISLHCPLTPDTYHLINGQALDQMKNGVMVVNTGRGALIDTQALIHGLKSGKIGSVGLDVYEEEADLFFEDLSNHVIQDDVLARLLTFPNVIVTSHQAFFTREAMQRIAEITLGNITAYERGQIDPANNLTHQAP